MKRAIRLLFLGFLAAYGAAGLYHSEWLWTIDAANLIFHESGHPVFSIFGRFIGMLGGTLMQLLVPGCIALALLKKDDRYGASIMLFWFGENFIHISRYAKDARAQLLPLIGGGIHDWNYLLGKAGLLEYDRQVGGFIWAIGAATMAAAVYFGWKNATDS